MKRTKHRWKHKKKSTALQHWLKKVRVCRTTLVSARQLRKSYRRLRREHPELHEKMKDAARTKRTLDRKLDGARVAWARKLWEGRREAEGRGTSDLQFPGALVPSPRRASKWLGSAADPFKHLLGKSKGDTRTPSPKLKLNEYRHDLHPLHQRRKVDISPRTGCYAQVREKEKKR